MLATYSSRKRSSAVGNDFEGDVAHPRALLAPCLLLLAESPGHGYELLERLKPLGFDWNGPGPIYRELRALEAANLVTSAWSLPKSGPVPRVYELTPAGRDALERCAAGISELRSLTDEYLTRFRAVTAPARRSAPASARTTAKARHLRRGRPSRAAT